MSESPLRQQIAETIHAVGPCDYNYQEEPDTAQRHLDAADAVLALLNLTEEIGQQYSPEGSAAGEVILPGWDPKWMPGSVMMYRLVSPWLPTPPDTSDVTQSVGPNEKV